MKTINKERRGILPILSTLVLGFASAVGFAVMYSFTKYLLLLLISLILLMPLMINLFLFIFSGVSKKDGEEDITEAENTSAKSLKLKLKKQS